MYYGLKHIYICIKSIQITTFEHTTDKNSLFIQDTFPRPLYTLELFLTAHSPKTKNQKTLPCMMLKGFGKPFSVHWAVSVETTSQLCGCSLVLFPFDRSMVQNTKYG